MSEPKKAGEWIGCPLVAGVAFSGTGILPARGLSMLRFAVFDDKGPAREWPLVGAHLLGPDDVAVSGEVRFANGEVTCRRRQGSGAVALALQYDAGAAGRLILQTCLLPDSDRPHVLSHELARHRIKTFLAKCEEWQMFELSADHPAITLWEEARQQFTLGLNAADPVAMDQHGRDSLEKAIESTERLAMAHAEVLLHRRYAVKPASGSTLGVRISTRRPPEQFADFLAREVDLIYVPLPWRDLEPKEGSYDWSATDRWMSWAHKANRPVVAGPLLDFSARAIPQWMYVWQHDYETCRDLCYDHMEKVVARYRNVVSVWSIAAGINVNENFRFSSSQMLDLTRMVNLLVKQGASMRRAKTMIEIVQPFGEHVSSNEDSLPPLTFIDRMIQEGIRVDCYGIQLGFGPGGLRARDIMQVSNMLDRFFLLELPLLITRIGVPSMPGTGDDGWWQQPWSPEIQARWMGRMFGVAMSKPHVESFFWSELFDDDRSDIAGAGLFDRRNQPKPAMQRLIEMRRRLRKPLGPLKVPAKNLA